MITQLVVRVAAGDVNTDGKAEIITGKAKGTAQVKVFSGVGSKPLTSFLPFDKTFKGGTFVAAGDLDGDGKAEIVASMGKGGSQVRIFAATGGLPLADYPAYADIMDFTGGLRVAVLADVNGDGMADILVGPGPGTGTMPEARLFENLTTTVIDRVFTDPNGTFVAGM